MHILYDVLSSTFELMANIFFECTVFIFSILQIWLSDMHNNLKGKRYYAHIRIDIPSLVYYIMIEQKNGLSPLLVP